MGTREDNDDDVLDIDLDLIGILKRRHLQIAIGIFVGATLATVYFFQQVPIYESEIAVLVGQRSSELATTGSGDFVEGATTVQEEILSTHMELFQSQAILADAIRRSNLPFEVGDIEDALEVSRGGSGLAKSASVLKASFQDPDPEMAAKVLQAIFDSYKAYIDERSRNVGSEAAELIASSLSECEENLRVADEEYREYIASVPGLVSTDVNGSSRLEDVHRIRLNKAEGELSATRELLAETRSRLQTITDFTTGKDPDALTEMEVMSLLTESEVRRLLAFVDIKTNRGTENQLEQLSREFNRATANMETQKLMDLVARRDKLASAVGTSHPTYQSVVQEIRSMEKFIRQSRSEYSEVERGVDISPPEMIRTYVQVLKSDLSDLENREQELLAISAEEAKLAKEIETKFMLSNSLKATLDRAQRRYDVVLERLQEINLTNNSSGFSTDLILTPFPADRPVWPSKTKIAALGLLGGGLLGLGLALLAEMTDRTFRDPKEVESVVGASIMAHVPRMDSKRATRKAKKGSEIAPMITSFHTPRGSDAETFRVMRTSVLFAVRNHDHRVLMVTSPSPGDGKSTTIANLAVSLAQTGKRVLLVDADMRRPMVHSNFGVDKTELGLADFLGGEAGFSEVLHETEQSHLTVCTHGSSTSEPSELLESPRLEEFLKQAREEFEVVLVDCPPLLAVADPAIVSEVVDGCLLIVRIEKNNRTLVERAAEILQDHGRTIDGIIVNSKISFRGGYGYSSYDYYGKHGYGYVSKYRAYYAASDGEARGGSRIKAIPGSSTNGHPSKNGHASGGSHSNGKHTKVSRS